MPLRELPPSRPALVEKAGQPEIQDLRLALLVDHDVLRLEIAVDDAQAVGLGQPVADLAGVGKGLRRGQVADLADEALEVLALDVFHGDVGDAGLFVEVEHPGDVPVDDLAGQLELGRKALDDRPVRGDFGPDELEADLLAELIVEDAVDAAHAAHAQLLDHLVALGEQEAGSQLGRREGNGLVDLGEGRRLSEVDRQRCPAVAAEVLACRRFPPSS